MDHVIAPLDVDHARAVTRLATDLAAALEIAPQGVAARSPHITVASYTGLEPARATAALAPVANATQRPPCAPTATGSSPVMPTPTCRST
jgi:hypothetical protein